MDHTPDEDAIRKIEWVYRGIVDPFVDAIAAGLVGKFDSVATVGKHFCFKDRVIDVGKFEREVLGNHFQESFLCQEKCAGLAKEYLHKPFYYFTIDKLLSEEEEPFVIIAFDNPCRKYALKKANRVWKEECGEIIRTNTTEALLFLSDDLREDVENYSFLAKDF